MNAARVLAWSLPALALLPRLWIALRELRLTIAADIVQDDSFYYFTIARNLLAGDGPSFDGVTPTNAFHPLFMGVAMAGVALFPDSPDAPVQWANAVLALCALLATGLLFAIARDWSPERGLRTAALAALLFACSPYFVVHTTNALETGLSLCANLAVIRAYQLHYTHSSLPAVGHAVQFGALAGVAILARVDALLLLAALAGDQAWRRRGSIFDRHFQLRSALALACALLVWLPWGLVSRTQTGAWLPTSGAASKQIALQLGWSNLQPIWDASRRNDRSFTPSPADSTTSRDPQAGTPAAYWADVFTKQVAVQTLEQPLLGPLRILVPYDVWPPLRRMLPFVWLAQSPRTTAAGLLAALGLLIVAARARVRRVRGASDANPRALGRVTGLYLALVLLAYTFIAPTHWYFARYSVLAVLLTMTLALTLAPRLARGGESSRGFALFALLLVAAQLWLGARFAANLPREPSDSGFLAAWETLSPSLPDGARLGAFQSGIYGWFGDRPVVNLDGKVNPDAQRALAANELHRYVRESELEYLLDWESMLRSLLTRHIPQEERESLHFEEVARQRARGGVVLWKIERDPRSARSGTPRP